MACTRWRISPSLISRLRTQPWRFEFFQAVRLVRLLRRSDQVATGRSAAGRTIRFRTAATCIFPEASVQAIRGLAGDDGDEVSRNPPEPAQPEVTTTLLGLIGVQGVLPRHYTDLIISRNRAGDAAMHAFLELFDHRMIELFHAGWEKTRFHLRHERGDTEGLLFYLRAIAGFSTPGLQGKLDQGLAGIGDLSIAFFTGLLGQMPRSASGLEGVLSAMLGCPVKVRQFHGRWLRIPVHLRARFGHPAGPDGGSSAVTTRLGRGVMLGERAWDRQSALVVRIGPMSRSLFCAFLPRKPGERIEDRPLCRTLSALLAAYLRFGLDVRLQLVLSGDEVPALRLSAAEDGVPPVLGLSTWLGQVDGGVGANEADQAVIALNEPLVPVTAQSEPRSV